MTVAQTRSRRRTAATTTMSAWAYLGGSPSREYRQRTEWNVRDSDATLIFTIRATLTGGSKLTGEFAAEHSKPWLHLAQASPGDAAAMLNAILHEHAVKVLNLTGSRASKK